MKKSNLKPFEQGQSGNPSGRKPGALSLKTYIKKWLAAEEKFQNPITEEIETLSQYDIIVLMQIAKARKGDTKAYEVLTDRIEGKAKQSIDLEQDISLTNNSTYIDYSALSPNVLRELLKHTKSIQDENKS